MHALQQSCKKTGKMPFLGRRTSVLMTAVISNPKSKADLEKNLGGGLHMAISLAFLRLCLSYFRSLLFLTPVVAVTSLTHAADHPGMTEWEWKSEKSGSYKILIYRMNLQPVVATSVTEWLSFCYACFPFVLFVYCGSRVPRMRNGEVWLGPFRYKSIHIHNRDLVVWFL